MMQTPINSPCIRPETSDLSVEQVTSSGESLPNFKMRSLLIVAVVALLAVSVMAAKNKGGDKDDDSDKPAKAMCVLEDGETLKPKQQGRYNNTVCTCKYNEKKKKQKVKCKRWTDRQFEQRQQTIDNLFNQIKEKLERLKDKKGSTSATQKKNLRREIKDIRLKIKALTIKDFYNKRNRNNEETEDEEE